MALSSGLDSMLSSLLESGCPVSHDQTDAEPAVHPVLSKLASLKVGNCVIYCSGVNLMCLSFLLLLHRLAGSYFSDSNDATSHFSWLRRPGLWFDCSSGGPAASTCP